jgi:hypothetical protein
MGKSALGKGSGVVPGAGIGSGWVRSTSRPPGSASGNAGRVLA